MNSVKSPKSKKRAVAISVRPVGTFLGAEITGVDLSKPLDEDTVDAIAQAHVEHGVIVFPDQKISELHSITWATEQIQAGCTTGAPILPQSVIQPPHSGDVRWE